VHEGDDQLFQLENELSEEAWDEWSDHTITLEHEHSISREVSHVTEDSNKTATNPIINRPLSVDEFRRLIKDGNDTPPEFITSNNNKEKEALSVRRFASENKILCSVIGACLLLFAWDQCKRR